MPNHTKLVPLVNLMRPDFPPSPGTQDATTVESPRDKLQSTTVTPWSTAACRSLFHQRDPAADVAYPPLPTESLRHLPAKDYNFSIPRSSSRTPGSFALPVKELGFDVCRGFQVFGEIPSTPRADTPPSARHGAGGQAGLTYGAGAPQKQLLPRAVALDPVPQQLKDIPRYKAPAPQEQPAADDERRGCHEACRDPHQVQGEAHRVAVPCPPVSRRSWPLGTRSWVLGRNRLEDDLQAVDGFVDRVQEHPQEEVQRQDPHAASHEAFRAGLAHPRSAGAHRNPL